MVANHEEEKRAGGRPTSITSAKHIVNGLRICHVLAVLDKQLQVDLEDGLQQTHVGTLVQPYLMLPDVDYQDLAGCQGEQGALPLEVLILAPFAAVGTLDVHDEDVVGHGLFSLIFALILGHPDTLCGLASLILGHDTERRFEQVVKQRRFAGTLRAEDGDQVVVEAGGGDPLDGQIVLKILATETSARRW